MIEMSERQKMLSGALYRADDAELSGWMDPRMAVRPPNQPIRNPAMSPTAP